MAEYPQVQWVTDLVTRQNLQELFDSDPEVAHGVKKIFSNTGRSVVPGNPFESDDCIRKCAEQHGVDIASTVSLQQTAQNLNPGVPVTPEERNAIVGSRKVWTLVSAQSAP